MNQHAAPSAPAAPPAPTSRPGRRDELLDGLRGAAIILVVLSHGWVLWPTEFIDDSSWLRPFFRNGNLAVTVFLFAAGFLTYRSLARRGLEQARIGVTTLRRVLRVAPLVLTLLVSVVVVAAFDDDDATSSTENGRAFWRISTFTWNWYVQDNIDTARWDLGHLWYLSVDLQSFLFTAFVIYLLRRRPVGLVAALLGLFLLFTWWRTYVIGVEPDLVVLLRTTARIDAFLAGALTAAALALVPRRPISPRAATAIGTAALVCLPVLLWYCSQNDHFVRWGVTLVEVDLAVLVAASQWATPALRDPALGPLSRLGRNSLPIYIWHYPVFAAVQRNASDWDWPARTAVALVVLTLVCVASYLLVERRVHALLAHPVWRRLERRTPAFDPAPESTGQSRVGTHTS